MVAATRHRLFAQAWTIEILMMLYRVWHVAPFAAIVFYAGLQTVNQDSLESAVIDGATRWQRMKYIVIPHLMPLIIFVSMIHLMDASAPSKRSSASQARAMSSRCNG